MERFFLFSVDDVLVVIRDDSVAPFLLCVVPYERVIEQFVIDRLDLFVTKIRIQMRALGIGILCVEFPAVVVRGAFPDLDADRSFQ